METLENFFPFQTPGLSRLMRFIKHNFHILLILLIAAFLRLYRIGDYMTFLGDEGRDVLVVKQILEGDPTLLGPRASAGDFFLGPIYYYLMTPFLWLWQLDPVGPAIMVALFGVATVFLVYYIGGKFFNKPTGIIAALLYAVSPLVIVYSRSSWNPNVMPFFTTAALLLLYFAITKSKLKYFLGVGILLGIIMQLHYLGTFVALIIAVFACIGTLIQKTKSWVSEISQLVVRYLVIFVGFVVGFSPFLLFEIRNGFPNLQNIFRFIFNRDDQTNRIDASYSEIVSDVFFRVFGRLLVNYPESRHFENYNDLLLQGWKIGIIILAIASVIIIFKMKNKIQMSLLLSWLIIGVMAFGFYKKPIYDYYFGFMFPVPFLMIGNLLSSVYKAKGGSIFTKIFSFALLGLILVPNIYFSPIRYEPNRQKDQIRTISEFVLSQTGDKPFNFALVTGGNSDHGYRYYFELNNKKPVTIENEIVDPERKTVTDQLLIICEEDCEPLGHSLWEIAGFGQAEIDGEWEVSVVKVYRLIPLDKDE